MQTFTEKLKQSLPFTDNDPRDITTPGRTDLKIVRNQDPEENKQYRSWVGSGSWLCLGLRYDCSYTVKELSRVLPRSRPHSCREPDSTANSAIPHPHQACCTHL